MAKKVAKTKTMTDLEACDCRWPIGDPRHADFHFCGAQKLIGRPYCLEHWHQSYMPGKTRSQQGHPAPLLRALPVRRAA